MQILEGYMPFHGLKTYYRVVGDPHAQKTPIVRLHGGPGSTHNYFELLDCLAEDGRQVIMYDQIGCGLSGAPGHTELFNRETWVEELVALREHLGLAETYLLGQSWGGMLLLEYVCGYHPDGIRGIVLSSTLPSSRLWSEEQHRMIREMPAELQEAIRVAEEKGVYSNAAHPLYEAANREFLDRHCCPEHWPDSYPECLIRKKGSGHEAYVTAWGPNEFTPLGNLKDWDRIPDLGSIACPALITSGLADECTPYIAKLMYDSIPQAEWELFRYSRHCAYIEEREKYAAVLRSWLKRQDTAHA